MRIEGAQIPSLAFDLTPTDVRIDGPGRTPEIEPESAAMEIDR